MINRSAKYGDQNLANVYNKYIKKQRTNESNHQHSPSKNKPWIQSSLVSLNELLVMSSKVKE